MRKAITNHKKEVKLNFEELESMVSDWFKANIPEDAKIIKDVWNATIKVATAFYAGSVGSNPGWCDNMTHRLKTLRFVQYYKKDDDESSIISEWIWEENGKICSGYYNPNKRCTLIGRHTCSVEIL